MTVQVCTGGQRPDSNPDKYDISDPNPAPDLCVIPSPWTRRDWWWNMIRQLCEQPQFLMEVGVLSFLVNLNSIQVQFESGCEYQFSLRIPNTFIWNANATIPLSGERKSGLVPSPWNVLHFNVQLEFKNMFIRSSRRSRNANVCLSIKLIVLRILC